MATTQNEAIEEVQNLFNMAVYCNLELRFFGTHVLATIAKKHTMDYRTNATEVKRTSQAAARK